MLPGSLHFLEGLRLSEVIGLPNDVPVFADNAARVALAGELVLVEPRGHYDVVMLSLAVSTATAASPGTWATLQWSLIEYRAFAAIAAAWRLCSRRGPSRGKPGRLCIGGAIPR